MVETLKSLGIDRLSPAERLELIGVIWDTLPEALNAADIPDWHREELERRITEADQQPDAAIPWDQVKATLGSP